MGRSFFFLNISNVDLLYTFLAKKESEPCKGKSVSSDIGILFPAPKILNANLNFKLRWRKILPLALRITSFWRQLGSSLGFQIPVDSSGVFLFAFPCWGLLCLFFLGEIHIFRYQYIVGSSVQTSAFKILRNFRKGEKYILGPHVVALLATG